MHVYIYIILLSLLAIKVNVFPKITYSLGTKRKIGRIKVSGILFPKTYFPPFSTYSNIRFVTQPTLLCSLRDHICLASAIISMLFHVQSKQNQIN
jgi:hypothetical protein